MKLFIVTWIYSPLDEATVHRKFLFRGGWNRFID